MNNWEKIWQSKGQSFEKKEDVFEMFCELKRANGFDVQVDKDYYRNFWKQWEDMKNKIEELTGGFESVYEVGCGSGVNLYMFKKLCGISRLAGSDYSEALIRIAKSAVEGDFLCSEAVKTDVSEKYDVVMADSVFQYFQDEQYGMKVLGRMYEKAEKLIVITEIHDIEKKELLLAHRRASVENYDDLYKGLDKTFYSREAMTGFAREHNLKIEIVRPQNKSYWNNDFVFDCYFVKQG